MLLADLAVRTGTRSIEITQRGKAQILGTTDVPQHALDRQLGAAIDIDRGLRLILGQRQALRVAVGGAGGRDDEVGAARPRHRLQQGDHAPDIIVPEAKRFALALTHLDIGGKVHHAIGFVRGEGCIKIGRIANVANDQGPPAHGVFVARRQIVEHHRLIAPRSQRLAHMRTDISCTTHYQYPHHTPSRCLASSSKAIGRMRQRSKGPM